MGDGAGERRERELERRLRTWHAKYDELVVAVEAWAASAPGPSGPSGPSAAAADSAPEQALPERFSSHLGGIERAALLGRSRSATAAAGAAAADAGPAARQGVEERLFHIKSVLLVSLQRSLAAVGEVVFGDDELCGSLAHLRMHGGIVNETELAESVCRSLGFGVSRDVASTLAIALKARPFAPM